MAAHSAKSPPGTGSQRIIMYTPTRTKPVPCDASSTFNSGSCLAFSPPRKSATPQEIPDANARARANTGAHLLGCRADESHSGRINRVRRRAHALRRARADARRLRRALLAGGELFQR